MSKRRTKRGVAVLTAISLMAAMLTGMGAEVRAAEPDVTKFATKDELLSSFDTDDTNSKNAKKVYFGWNDYNNRIQEWHIVGKDPVGEGLVLFAALSIGNEKFEPDWLTNKSYDPDWDCDYGGNEPTDVFPNHYGASPIRRTTLKGIETNPAYFSAQEQTKMLTTTITTKDAKNDSTYTTTDKLYLAYADWDASYITVGTNQADALNDGLHIDEDYWLEGTIFYLRTPDDFELDPGRVFAPLRGGVYIIYVESESNVAPAFQLDVSTVLFGSVAPAAASDGSLTTSDTFTLRYDAEGALGSATIKPDKTGVEVKGAPAGGAYLMVQNDSGAWAKSVSGDVAVQASDIDSSLTSLTDCKVWLETTNGDRITTAVMAVQGYSVEVTPGGNMTKTTDSGEESQTVASGSAMKDVVYTAAAGYYFPEDYNSDDSMNQNGITVTRNSYTQITAAGTPTTDAAVAPAAPTVKAEQAAPEVEGGVEQITGTDSTMEYAGSAAAENWTACTDTATSVAAGTWYVRYKETDTKKASPVTEVVVDAVDYTIQAAPSSLNFGTKDEGYTSPDAQTVTVTNKGNSEVTLTHPTSTGSGYTIGGLSKTTLAAAETAAFTIQPTAGLGVGTYEETITVSTEKGTSAEITVSFTVTKKPVDPPKITKGADNKWTKGSKNGLSFTSNADFADFLYVAVDGKELAGENYTVKAGSTVVTLKPEYLETLAAEKHTIGIASGNGTAETSFTVVKKATKPAEKPTTKPAEKPAEKPTAKPNKPKTGDDSSPYLWITILLLAGGCIVGCLFWNKKKPGRD